MNLKRLNQRLHAKRRASERLGLTLNRNDFAELITMIQDGQSTLERKISLRQSVRRLEWRGREIRLILVYDCNRHQIVTFLTEDMK